MSGECGYHRSPLVVELPRGMSEELAKSASATLGRLNSMMKQMNDWREERLALQSNVQRLKSALKKLGKSPDEALRPDPLMVHQRSEINRLELTVQRLEGDVRSLRETLREADQAITCSGARRLKEKMTKMREDREEECRKLRDEIGHLKLRVKEAEDDSSCSSMSRLRLKLREILNGDKKMERVIADVASRGCGTVIDLSNELTRIKELLEESRLENIGLNRERKRIRAALESAPAVSGMVSGFSSHPEAIERLGFRVKELEHEVKEFEADSGLVKRVEELENALNENRKELEAKEAVVTSLRNEILGAKTAYRMKSEELEAVGNLKTDFQFLKKTLEKTLEERDQLVTDLQRQLETSASTAQEIERVKTELDRVKPELLNSEIERDGLLADIENLGIIVSDRNEHIVKILEENEARRSEIEGMNTRLKIRCKNLEEELSKLNEVREGSGDRSAPLVKKIKELEEELAELKNLFCPPNGNSTDSNSEVKTLDSGVNTLEESEARLEDLVDKFTDQLNESRSENTVLKNSIEELEPKNAELIEELGKIVSSAKEEIPEGKNRGTQTEDNFQKNLYNLEADNSSLKSDFVQIRTERDALKYEFKKLSSSNNELNTEVEKLKIKVDKFEGANQELNEEVKRYESLTEKLRKVEEELKEEALEEVNSVKEIKASIDNLKMENEKLRMKLKKENRERAELVKSMEKLRAKVEEESKIPALKNELEKLRVTADSATETEAPFMNRGDYVRADRELKYYIHLQSLGVKRIVDFIGYLEGTTSVRPSMAKFSEPTTTEVMVLNFDENLTATFRMSQKLSEKIFAAETSVQKLEELKNERNNLRAECDCLNKGMERLSEMLSKFGQEILLPQYILPHVTEESGGYFENETDQFWLQLNNLTTESSTLTRKNGIINDEDKFLLINTKISNLQKQIKSKQEEAGQRLIEMRETMRQERIQLMEIAEREKA